MTPKEAIDKITWTPLMRSPHENGELKEALYMACNALENADKYCWHDLRKNPNDLPPNFHTVVICLRGFEGLTKGVDLAMHNNLSSLWGTKDFTYKESDVIAWREIEPFRE